MTLAAFISTTLSPSLMVATNGSDRWGVQSGLSFMSNTYPMPTEIYENQLTRLYAQIDKNAKYHRVTNTSDDLIDVAVDDLGSSLTEGIVINSNQTQAEVNANTTWSGSAWSTTKTTGEANPDNQRTITASGVKGASFKIKDYAVTLGVEYEGELLSQEVTLYTFDETSNVYSNDSGEIPNEMLRDAEVNTSSTKLYVYIVGGLIVTGIIVASVICIKSRRSDDSFDYGDDE